MGWLRVQNIVVIIKDKTRIKETVKWRNTLFIIFYIIQISTMMPRDGGVRLFFISLVHGSWTAHFVRFFNRSKNNWFCSFSKWSYIFHLFSSFSHWTMFSKIVCSTRSIVQKNDRFFKSFQKIVSLVKKISYSFVFFVRFLKNNHFFISLNDPFRSSIVLFFWTKPFFTKILFFLKMFVRSQKLCPSLMTSRQVSIF